MIAVTLTYDTSRPQTALDAYSLHIAETTDEATGVLMQCGPVWNNIVRDKGVFATLAAALQAVLQSVSAPCVITRDTAAAVDENFDVSLKTTFRLRHPNTRPACDIGSAREIVARKTLRGIRVAA